MKNISKKIEGHLNHLKKKLSKMNTDFREMELKIESAYQNAKRELAEVKEKETKEICSFTIMLEQKLKELS